MKILSVACILFLCAASAQAKPRVLSSIKPLTLIAQEIVGSAVELDTLLPITASPHDYPLKMSDYSRLNKADIVLWVGPELEGFLQKPLANLARGKIITAYTLAGLNWPEDPPHGEADEHHHERDPHLWLDPRNAVVVAHALSVKLIQLDPDNKALYEANLSAFADKMASLDRNLTAKLLPFANLGFAVYHEGYRHFVNHYGLRQLNYVTFTPEQRPGAKHLQELRLALAKEGKCLFLEPYHQQQSMMDLANELKLHTGTLDALGSYADTRSYSQLLELMADAFANCLKQ